jgi:galactokinase
MSNEETTIISKDSITVQSPGRINIIGEHTDYNDGFVFPAAVDLVVKVHMKKNGSEQTAHITATDLKQKYTIDLQEFSPIGPGWENYVMGVIAELQKLGAKISGFDASFSGNVPIGGGMSSSAALECSFAYALNEVFNLGFTTNQLVKACQMAEHNFVGTKCGIMDQFASMMGKKDQVILLDCRSLEYKYFPLELGDYQILLLDTNVSHSLASSEYNTRRSECEIGVAHLQKGLPEIKNLRDVTLDQLNTVKQDLAEVIYRRCHHVIAENDRVIKATDALKKGDLELLGQLIYQSHLSLQHDYEVSCPELDFLVQETIDKDYVLGSRMMGGGFGGCTINIIKKDKVEAFVDEVTKRYQDKFGLELTPITTNIGDGTKTIR